MCFVFVRLASEVTRVGSVENLAGYFKHGHQSRCSVNKGMHIVKYRTYCGIQADFQSEMQRRIMI